MEIKYLQTFKTISETGSFQKAAQRLHYAQSTVTFQIQQLERELSVKLFERIGRQMVLSQAGRDLLPYVENILRSVEQIEHYGRDGEEPTGSLRLAMPETLLTYRMQPILQAFRAQAPRVKLSVQMLNCFEIRDAVASGRYDLGVHYDVGNYGPSMVVQRLTELPLALIGAASLDDHAGDFITAGQRKELSVIVGDPNSIFQGIFDAYLERKRIVFSGSMGLNSIEAIKRSVASNLGVSFLPRFVAEEELRTGTVKELKTELAVLRITAICLYHKNKWISPAMELMIRLLTQNFAE